MLPLCVGLALLGVVLTGIAWRRGNRGRVIQGVGLALAPVALYLSGLLRLLWDGLVAVLGWASRIVFSPAVWLGLALLGLCLVLWVVGGIVARRSPGRRARRRVPDQQPAALPARGAVGAQPAGGKPAGPRGQPPVDDELAEIEALLKARGIE